jgi:hypothetical protein
MKQGLLSSQDVAGEGVAYLKSVGENCYLFILDIDWYGYQAYVVDGDDYYDIGLDYLVLSLKEALRQT